MVKFDFIMNCLFEEQMTESIRENLKQQMDVCDWQMLVPSFTRGVVVVLEDLGRATETGPRLLTDVPIDVGDRHDVAEHACLIGDDGPLISHSDRRDPKPFDFGPRFLLSRSEWPWRWARSQ